MSIALLTFDIFGTVVDWRRGLAEALGRPLDDAQFDAVVDRQGQLERGPFLPYAEIVARSLVEVLHVEPEAALLIGERAGRWPLFPDSAQALRKLRAIAPCAAITNSDRAHAGQLTLELDGWICAEDERVYKPAVDMWQAASRRMRVPFSRDWWHVSAYADYDLATARRLGLTCVFVQRGHSRAGESDMVVADLESLVTSVRAAAAGRFR